MKPKKHSRQQDILFVIISSFVVVAAWVGFNLYHITITSTVAPEVQAKLRPIDPSFDTATIQQLKTRENIVPAFERQQTASTAAPTQEPTPISAEPTNADTRFAPTETPIKITGQ